jgi:membrane fusion protein (multidrug efflux system)
MKKTRFIALSAFVMAVLALVAGKALQAENDAKQEKSYTGIVTVSGLVLKHEPFTRKIEESGTLVGRKESVIAAETGGQVMQVLVDVGDVVRAGSPLVRLDDELLELEAARALVAFDKAKLDFERVEKLYLQKSISDSELEGARLGMKAAEVQYRMAKKTFEDATIRAPFAGTLAAKFTEVGQMLDRGQPVVQLVDVSTLKLTLNITENDISDVVIGAPVEVLVESIGESYAGAVTAVGSRALNNSRTFPVEIEVPGNERLRSGMFARATVTLGVDDKGLLLPRAATLPDVGRIVVFLVNGDKAEKKSVKIIGSDGDRVAVNGISEGDTVIVTGNQMLSQGSKISLTLNSGAGHDGN